MIPNALRARWQNGETVYGVTVRLGSTWIVEAFARAGFDYIYIDQQHGLNPDDVLLPMFQILSFANVTSLVRVPANDGPTIGRILDAGADGVIVPMIETANDAARAVAACHYGPAGTRSHAALRLKYLPDGSHRDVLCFVQIETQLGVDNAIEIASTPGVDGVYVGPGDLALSMGLEAKLDPLPDAVLAAIARVREVCDAHGVATAISGEGKEMTKQGFKLVTVGADSTFIEAGVRNALASR